MGRLKHLLLGLYCVQLAWADCKTPLISTDLIYEDCPDGRNTPGCRYTLACKKGFLPSFPERYPNMIGNFTCGSDNLWMDDKGVKVALTLTDPNMLACVPGCIYPAPTETSLYVVEAPPSKVYTFPTFKENNKLEKWIYGGDNFTLRCQGERVVMQKTVQSNIMSATYTCRTDPNTGENFYHYVSSTTKGEEILSNCKQSCLFNVDNKHGSVEGVQGAPDSWRDGGILSFECMTNTAFKAGSPAFGRDRERLRCDAKNNILIDTYSETPSQQSPCVQNLIPGQCYWPGSTHVEVTSTNCENTTAGVKAECTMSLKCQCGYRPTSSKFLTPTGVQTITCKDGIGWVDETGQPAIFIQCEEGCIREVLETGPDQSHTFPDAFGKLPNGTVLSATCRNLTIYKKPPPDHPYYCADLENTGNCSLACRSPQPLPPGVLIVNKGINDQVFIVFSSPFNLWIMSNRTALYKCQDGYQYPEGSSPAQHGGMQRIHCDWDRVMTDADTGVVNPTLVGCVPTTGCPIIEPGWSADITNATENCVRDEVKREYNNDCTFKYDCNSGTYPNETEYVAANGQEITCKSGKWYNIKGEEVTKSLTCQYGCSRFNLTEFLITNSQNGTNLVILYKNYTDSVGQVQSSLESSLYTTFLQVLNKTLSGNNKYYCNFLNITNNLIANVASKLVCPNSCLTLDLTTAPANPNLISIPANFTTDLNQTYVGANGTYEFECPAGKVVPGQQPGYKQKLICGPDSLYVNLETNEVLKSRNISGLKACTESSVCSLPNITILNIDVKTNCKIVELQNPGLEYNCSVNITCFPGYFPVTASIGTSNLYTVVCGVTNNRSNVWIDVSTGEELKLNCTPGVCPAPVNTTSVTVTSNCAISNGFVTNNCTVTEQCKEGFFPVDMKGMTGNVRSSFCNTTKESNSTLINIVTGEALPPLNCTEKAQCTIPKPTTTVTNSSNCMITDGKVNYGCLVTEQCLEGFYPINVRAVVNNTRVYNCSSFDNKNSTLVEITTGEILEPLNCSKPCANLTLPAGTTLTSFCVVQKDGYTVGCNASLVCESGLQVNISGRVTTVRNVRCDKISETNSTFIDIITGEPVDMSPCVCPINVTNSTIFKGNCIVPGQGGPPGCSIEETCAPGTAPIWTNAGVTTNRTLVCGVVKGTNNHTWVEIVSGELTQLSDCPKVCPAVTVPNAQIVTICTIKDGGYQVGCTATVECDQGFQGINVKYNFASKLNITCKGITKDNSTFIEITTGEPFQGEICGIPPTTQAPLVCKPITTTNVRTDSTCYISGAGAPLGCQANLTCIPGTYPVYVNGTVLSTVTVYCNGTTSSDSKTWIDVFTGAPLEDKPCWPPCPQVTLPGTKFNSSCSLLKDGDYQVGCNATLICDSDYLPVNGSAGTNPVTNLICKNHNNTASTWINVVTGEPLSKGPCAKPDCALLNNTNSKVDSTCYFAGSGAALGCDVNVTCLPIMYPVCTTRGFNTTDHLKCEKKEGQTNGTWIRIETGEEVKGDECQPPCPTYPGTKFNSSCGMLKDGGFQVGCNATLICEEGFTPVDVATGSNPTNIFCKNVNSTTSIWVKITTGEPVTKPTCTKPDCSLLNNTNVITNSTCYVLGSGAPLGCEVNTTCIPGTYPVYNTVGVNITDRLKCEKREGQINATWVRIETGEEVTGDNCQPPCPNITFPGIKFNSSCAVLKEGGFQVGCNSSLQCGEGYIPIDVSTGTNPLTLIQCKNTAPNISTWINVQTGEPVTKPPCTPESCPSLNLTKAVPTSTCYVAGGSSPINCTANLTCLPGMYPVLSKTVLNQTTAVKCGKSTTGSTTWILIETGEEIKGKECEPPCPNVTYPGTKFNSSCGMLKDGGFQVGCNATLVCEDGFTPIDIESEANPVTNIVCKKVNTTTSVWVKITTGESVTKPPCEVEVTTAKPTTLKPPEKCTWSAMDPLSEFTGSQCQDPADFASFPPILYAYCNVSYACRNNSVSATYSNRKNMTLFCNKNSSTDAGIWIEVETGQPLKQLNCTRVCNKLVLPPGTKQTSQTCPQATLYNLNCQKEFVCTEESSPTSGTPPKNTAVCRTTNGIAKWVDPTTNADYVGLNNCPLPKSGCYPIDHSNTTRVFNASCTPFPTGIHPENCKIDVECLPDLRPVDINDKDNPEHVAECIKNNATGNYDWFDRTKNQWYVKYDCTKECIPYPDVTASNTTVITYPNGTTHVCNFTSVKPGTGKYYCDRKDIIDMTCNNTCKLLGVPKPLVIGTKPELIKESVVPIGGQYEIYCPNGYFWKGTTNPSKKYTCGADGKYTSGQETGVNIVVNTCEKPTVPAPNCTLNLTDELEIKSSTCNTGDLIYEGGCLVTVQCKKGKYPSPSSPSQERLCDSTGGWIDPVTKGPLKPYACGGNCTDPMTQIIRNTTTSPTVTIDGFLVVCTEVRIDREMIKYLCGNTSISETDPILERNCTNMCQPIGLGEGMTNTNTWPDRYFNKVIVGGITEVQCPPGTVFNDTGIRQKNFTCHKEGSYITSNDPNSYLFVHNTCVNESTPKTTCGELQPGAGTVLGNQNCTGPNYAFGCIKSFVCGTGTVSPSTNPGRTSSAVCKNVSGTPTWVDPATNGAYKSLVCPSPTGCTPIEVDPTTSVSNNVSCAPLPGGIHPENCQVHVDCRVTGEHPEDKVLGEHVVECLKNNISESYEWFGKTKNQWWIKYRCEGPCLPVPTDLVFNSTRITWPNGIVQICNFTSVKPKTGKYYCLKNDIVKSTCNGTCVEPEVDPTLTIGTRPELIFGVVPIDGIYVIYCPNGTVWSTKTNNPSQAYKCLSNGRYIPIGVPDASTVLAVKDTCVKPTTPLPNCTLSLTTNLKVVSSSCDQGDLVYEGGCLVTVRCKNGSYPTATGTQQRLCDATGHWVDPVTKGPLIEYPCGSTCIYQDNVVTTNRTTQPVTINGVNVVCTEYRVDPEIVRYLCNNSDIDPSNPVIKTNCTNVCEPIGLGDGLTNTITWPERYYNKTIIGGITQVQCPPGMVWSDSGVRQKNFTCQQGGSYTAPNDQNFYIFVPNTCVKETAPSNPNGCSPIEVDPTTIVKTNVSCNPLPGSIHPENCQVHVICLDYYHPVKVSDRENTEHLAECLKNPTSGKYEWFDKTKNSWWRKYKCEKPCLPPPINLAANTTVITWANGTKQICNYTSVKPGTGKYYCLENDIVTSSCNGTCPQLITGPGLIIGTKPDLVFGAVLVGGVYVIYCPNGTVWSTETNNPGQAYKCETNGRYTAVGVPDAPTVLQVLNTCVKPTTPGPNCTLELTAGLVVADSSCDTGDLVYEGRCLVKVKCKNGTYPNPEVGYQLRLCDATGKFVDPVTRGPLTEYKCGPNCIESGSNTVVKNSTTGSETVFGVNVTCVVTTVSTALIEYLCNKTTPKDNVVSRDCTNTCEPIGLDVGLTNTRTLPDRYYNKTIIGGVTEVQCPPGSFFKETGTRQKNYTCKADGKYETPGGTTNVIFVPNTCTNETTPPTNPNGCNPIEVVPTTYVETNVSCNPLPGRIHPENCQVHINCLKGTHPEDSSDRYPEHLAECLKNPSGKSGKYEWFDKTKNSWWVKYKCVGPCLPPSATLDANTTVITWNNGTKQICNYTSVKPGTGKYYCLENDIVTSSCNGTCPQLITGPGLIVGTKPDLVFGAVLVGGVYVIYCPNGTVWSTETNNPGQVYKCETNGRYTAVGVPDAPTVLQVLNTCVKPTTPGPNCTLELTTDLIVSDSSCDTGDLVYEGGCLVKVKCKNGSYPNPPSGFQLRLCDSSGRFIDPVTRGPLAEYKCGPNCVESGNGAVVKNSTIDSRLVFGVNVTCVVTTVNPALIEYLCNKTDSKGNVISRDCANTCEPINLDVGLTNTRTWPDRYYNKTVLGGVTQVQCPPGFTFKETGTRQKNYTCKEDGKYETSGEATHVVYVQNTCVNETVKTIPGCVSISIHTSTEVSNSTCVPTGDGTNPEWCIVDVVCKNGSYPENGPDQNRSEHKVQCQKQNDKFVWTDLTLGNVLWTPYKCCNGCISTVPATFTNQTVTLVNGEPQNCTVQMTIHKTGRYYCNVTDDVVYSNCTNVCPPLIVNPPLVTRSKPTLIYEKWVANGGKYEVYCNTSYYWPETGLSYKNYTCQNGAYTDGKETGILSVTNTCQCLVSNCILKVIDPVIVEQINCNPSGESYEYGCSVILKCKDGYRPAGKAGSMAVTKYYQKRQCGNNTWIDLVTKQPAEEFTWVKDCIDQTEVKDQKVCTKPMFETRNGVNATCYYCSFPEALQPYLCPNATKKEDCCDNVCPELEIDTGLNKKRYATLIFTNKVALNDYYTVECPTGKVFVETGTRGQNYTCNQNKKYNSSIAFDLTKVMNTCVDSTEVTTKPPIPSTPSTTPPTPGGPPTVKPIPSCKDAIAPEGTQDFNYTCGPINLFGENCMVSFKCMLGYYPKLISDRKLLNRTAKCTYPRWIDTLDGTEFKMFECVKGCLNETSSLPQSAVKTREITQAGKALKCNVTTYLGDDRLYYCKATEYATVSCPETCPELIVRSPRVTTVAPLNLILNKVVLGGDKYIVSCPAGQVIEDRTTPAASSRPYTCDSIEGKYFNTFDEEVLEANFTCIPAGTGTCTLPPQPSTTVVTSSCSTSSGTYQISCVVSLSCPTGSSPEQLDDQVFGQRVIQCQNKTASGVDWVDLNTGLAGFKNYSCKSGCLQAQETKTQPSFLVGNTPISCNISTIPVGAVPWQCSSSPALSDGTTKHDCSNGCKELKYKGEVFYVDLPPVYYHYVMVDSNYTFFCPPGAFFNSTKAYYQVYTCQKDGTYRNPIGLPLSVLDSGCTEIPQGGLGKKQNITITGPEGASEDSFIGVPVTVPMFTPVTPVPTLGEEGTVTQEHITVPGDKITQPAGVEATTKALVTSTFTLGLLAGGRGGCDHGVLHHGYYTHCWLTLLYSFGFVRI